MNQQQTVMLYRNDRHCLKQMYTYVRMRRGLVPTRLYGYVNLGIYCVSISDYLYVLLLGFSQIVLHWRRNYYLLGANY